MEAIALAIKPTKKTRKKRVNDVPSNEGSNPMAPANTKPVRGGTKTGKVRDHVFGAIDAYISAGIYVIYL